MPNVIVGACLRGSFVNVPPDAAAGAPNFILHPSAFIL
jgi:hypothetical protein